MLTNNQKLQHIIEQLCTTGCDQVNEVIEILEQQGGIEQTGELNEQEYTIVLLELKTIMAMYDQE